MSTPFAPLSVLNTRSDDDDEMQIGSPIPTSMTRSKNATATTSTSTFICDARPTVLFSTTTTATTETSPAAVEMTMDPVRMTMEDVEVESPSRPMVNKAAESAKRASMATSPSSSPFRLLRPSQPSGSGSSTSSTESSGGRGSTPGHAFSPIVPDSISPSVMRRASRAEDANQGGASASPSAIRRSLTFVTSQSSGPEDLVPGQEEEEEEEEEMFMCSMPSMPSMSSIPSPVLSMPERTASPVAMMMPMPMRTASPVAMIPDRNGLPPPSSSVSMMASENRPRSRTLSRAASVASLNEPTRPRAYSARYNCSKPPRPGAGAGGRRSVPHPGSHSGTGSVASRRSLKRTRSVTTLGNPRYNPLSQSTPHLDIAAINRNAGRATSVTPPLANYQVKLPTLDMGGPGEFNMISPGTLVEVMEGKHDAVVNNLYVIDCRFPFEYKGGHIEGALNLHTKDMLEDFFMKIPLTDTIPTIVFHCEFSSKRGPTQYKHLRGLDRLVNVERYPEVFYPEIYVLQGGYKAFYTLFETRCEPQAYVSMFDSGAEDERCSHMVDLRRNYKRSRSFSDISRIYGDGAPNLRIRLGSDPTTSESSEASPSSSYGGGDALESPLHTAPVARRVASSGWTSSDDDNAEQVVRSVVAAKEEEAVQEDEEVEEEDEEFGMITRTSPRSDLDLALDAARGQAGFYGDEDVMSMVAAASAMEDQDDEAAGPFELWRMDASPLSRPRQRQRTLSERGLYRPRSVADLRSAKHHNQTN